MGKLDGLKIGFGICASFCNFQKVIDILERIKKNNDVMLLPIMTENAQKYNTRFANAIEYQKKIEMITGRKILKSPVEVEPLGPQKIIDLMVVLPMTGNTMAKLNNGITDNVVLGAIKSLRRQNKPTIIGLSSNDILGINFKNLGELINTKHIYFIPLKMDDPILKPNSLVSDFSLLEETIVLATKGVQITPILVS